MAKKTATKNTKTSKTKKVEPVVETPVEETPVVETPAVEETVVEVPYKTEFEALQLKLRSALTLLKELTSEVGRLEKQVQRDRRVLDKKARGRVKRVVDPNRPPSGFAKPGPVSDELRKFLGLSKDELIARTEVTKRITAYCREHKLQNSKDRRMIDVNGPLRKLLRLKKDENLTFFNLQKYMKVHYPNKDGVYSN